MNLASDDTTSRLPTAVNLRFRPAAVCAMLVVASSLWILQGFLHAILAACITAIASWPLYMRFDRRLPRRMHRSARALIFTLLMTVFVLAPLMFASSALVTEASALLAQVATADRRGIGPPAWLQQIPMIGNWLEGRWKIEFAYPGALQAWTQRTDAVALLGWAELLGQFMARHAFIVVFTVLLLFVLYREGQVLADGFRRVLRNAVGERAEAYVDLATRAIRASVNSMLVVALFDGFATAIAYTVVGVPHAGLWAAITGLLALVPFLGYVAVLALGVQLAVTGAATSPLVALGLGCLVLFCGDKVVRPLVGRHGLRLRFVLILMGCLGGFEALGLVGLVVGPVVLTLARELWEQRVRDVTPGVEASTAASAQPTDR